MMPRARIQTYTLLLLMTLLSAGCTLLGPDYQQPKVDIESTWIDEHAPKLTTAPLEGRYWWRRAFQEPMLDQLIARVLEQNLSLRSAGLRVLQSQQQFAIAVGNQYPQQQIGAGVSRDKAGGMIANNYDAGFNVSWEADVWGRFSRQVESASAELDASVARYDGVMVSLIAEVARNFILTRTYQQRVEVLQENIDQQAESLRIARAKYNAGEVTELDVAQAESLYNNTKATLSSLEIALQQSKNSLAILLAEPPQQVAHLLDPQQPIPTTQAAIALGMPQDLLRRRPDIRAAEQQLAAQSAQIGFAITELYPHFSLGGAIGSSAAHSDQLFESDTSTWNLFASFEWNVFNAGRLESNVRLQDARFQQLLADYQETIIQAQVDVENAIVAYLKSHEQLAFYVQAEKSAQRAAIVSMTQYREGLVDFNTVINTLSAHAQQQDRLAATQGAVATNLVTVYKTLGGGWEIRGEQDPVDRLPREIKDAMIERTDHWQGVLN